MMKSLTKKILAGVLAASLTLSAGLCLAGGAGDDPGHHPPKDGRHMKSHGGERPFPHLDKATVAKEMSKRFGVDEKEVRQALEDGKDFRDVGRAAMLAKISQKSFKDILAMKNKDKNWPEIEKSLGITPDKIRSEMDKLTAERIAEHGVVSKEQAEKLLQKGYNGRDIEMAGLIAKKSGKSIEDVLNMKKINNRWQDVAKSLGVSEDLRPGRDKEPREKR